MKIFLDDERLPVDESLLIVRSYYAFVRLIDAIVDKGDKIEYISFDHDLGTSETGKTCAEYLVDQDLKEHILSEDFKYDVHSMNPVGAENIGRYLANYLEFKKAP